MTDNKFNFSNFVRSNFMLILAFLSLLVPTIYELSITLWQINEQEHGPIILAIVLWLFWQSKGKWAVATPVSSNISWLPIALALPAYIFGRSQEIFLFEIGSFVLLVTGLSLLFKGWQGLKAVWFPILFMVFLIPLPGTVVDALTGGLKSYVSFFAEAILYNLGYPVARSGVLITVGQYQLLVADACSGMHSMFSLFAMGLLYLYLQAYSSVARNLTLFLLIAPIAFFANIVRVLILILVTYYLGDEAGQGFIHDMAGFVVFAVSLLTLFLVDKGLGVALVRSEEKTESVDAS